MRRTAISFLFLFAFGRGAGADEADIAVLDALQAQVSACVAFYAIELRCAEKQEFESRLRLAWKRSQALARAISMIPTDATTRLDLNVAADWSLMQESCEGIARIESRYRDPCEPLSSAAE
jgi:hypothetical protein